MTAATRIRKPNGSVHKKTVRKLIAYACLTAWPTATRISVLMPGTWVNTPLEMPSNKAGSDLAGRPAAVAAGATYSGKYFVNSFDKTDE